VGVVVALAAEISTILPAVPPAGEPVRINAHACAILTGMGAARAGSGAKRLLTYGADALLCWGTAAALVDGLSPGAMLVPDRLVGEDSVIRNADLRWSASLRTRLSAANGSLVDPGHILASEQEKRELRRRTGAVAADMESAAVAQVAHRAGVPFAAVRAISDAPTTPLPARILAAVDPVGRLPPHALLHEVVLRPTAWPGLIRLGLGFARARTSLKHAWRTLGEDALPPDNTNAQNT
jgi:adenosylhomocysteine nucleosidase